MEGARKALVHNIYRSQGTSSFITNFSHNSDFPDCFSAAPHTSDMFSLTYHVPLDASIDHILLGDFNWQYPL